MTVLLRQPAPQLGRLQLPPLRSLVRIRFSTSPQEPQASALGAKRLFPPKVNLGLFSHRVHRLPNVRMCVSRHPTHPRHEYGQRVQILCAQQDSFIFLPLGDSHSRAFERGCGRLWMLFGNRGATPRGVGPPFLSTSYGVPFPSPRGPLCSKSRRGPRSPQSVGCLRWR